MEIDELNVRITADASGLEKAADKSIKSVKKLSEDTRDEIKSMIAEWNRLQKELSQVLQVKGMGKWSTDYIGSIEESMKELKKVFSDYISDIPTALMDDFDFDFSQLQIPEQPDVSEKIDDGFEELNDTLDETNDKLGNTDNSLKGISNELDAINGVKFEDMNLEELNKYKDSLTKWAENWENTYKNIDPFSSLGEAATKALQDINTVLKSIDTTIFNKKVDDMKAKLASIGKGLGTAIGKSFSVFYKAANGVGKAIKSISNYISKIKSKWKGLGGNNDFLKNIKKCGLALLGIRGAFTAIRKSMSTYLAQNEELQNKLNSIWYALGSLFAPALEVLVNILAKILSLINALAKALGFAGINMKKLGSSAGSTSKQLASFDEINNLTESSGSSSTDYDFSWLEDIDLPGIEWLSNIMDKLLAWLPKFNQLMETAGEKINQFSEFLLKSFTYIDENGIPIKQKIEEFMTGIADGINLFIDKVNWEQLGQAIGSGLDLAITGLRDLIYGIEWQDFGSSLAEGANGMIEMIDFKALGELLLSGFNSIFSSLHGFFNSLEWDLISTKITEGIEGAIDSIKPEDISETLNGLLVDLPQTVGKVLRSANWQGLGETISDIFDGLNIADIVSTSFTTLTDFSGSVSEAISGALQGIDIGETLSKIIIGILDSAIEVIQDPRSSMKILEVAATLISSITAAIVTFLPKLFMSLGDWIQNGITTGEWDNIGDNWAEAFGDLGDAIANPWKVAFENIETATEEAMNNTKASVEDCALSVNGNFNNMSNVAQNYADNVTSHSQLATNSFQSFRDRFSEMSDNVSLKQQELSSATVTNFENMRSTLETTAETMKQTATQKWNEIKTAISDKINEIKSNLTEKWGEISLNATNTWSNIKLNVSASVDNIKVTLSNKWNEIKNNISSVWTSIKNTFLSIWDGIKNGIKTRINNIISFINGFISGICRGVNAVIDALNKINFTVPNNAITRWAGIAGANFGINISHIGTPSIPYLAEGGVIDKATLAMVGESGREIVTPENLLRTIVNEGNAETNSLLADVLRAIDSIELKPYVTVKDVGSASVKYINQQTRVLGGSVIG